MAKQRSKKNSNPANEAQSGLGGKVRQFMDFFEESKVEIKKVVWPSRKETIATSVAVLVFTLTVAVFLGLVDGGLSWLVNAILS